nr:MAG TPA: hypothetical protein [Caudoviricetes sp.]
MPNNNITNYFVTRQSYIYLIFCLMQLLHFYIFYYLL